MSYVTKLKCLLCNREYDPGEVKYSCPHCGYDGILEVHYAYDEIRKIFSKDYLKNNNNFSMWRYLPLLPVDNYSFIGPLKVGWTPLYEARRIRENLNMNFLWIKDDGRNPTASLKDRASAIAIVKARELDNDSVTCASTGNAASSLAGASASTGLKSFIFVPRTAPKAKIAQLLIFGAKVFAVKGSYDEAFDLSIKATEEFGWYNRNTAFNPYMVEGKKTVALEIAEQLSFNVPDYIFVSVGDGCIISGIAKGYKDLYNLGLIDSTPKLVAVQAEGCSPIVDALNENSEVKFVEPHTIADSIAVGIPRNRIMAMRDIRNSKGFGVKVSDSEILSAIKYLGESEGIFAEPAGIAAFAGLLKALREKLIKRDSKVVVLITGNGLKDIDSAMKAVSVPFEIEPKIEEVKRALKEK
jgi:threonine synthase